MFVWRHHRRGLGTEQGQSDPAGLRYFFNSSDTGFAAKAAIASGALASLFRCSGAKATIAASDRAVAKARRVTIN